MTNEQLLADYRVMLEADKGHLTEALESGARVSAHQFVDSIVDLVRSIQDLEKILAS